MYKYFKKHAYHQNGHSFCNRKLKKIQKMTTHVGIMLSRNIEFPLIYTRFLPAAKPTGLVETNSSSSKKMQMMDVLNLLTMNDCQKFLIF